MDTNGHKRFVATARTCSISFDEDSPYHGLEAEMSTRATVADLIRLGQAWQRGDPDEMGEAADSVGKYLIRWNLEEPTEDGGSEPVPASPEGWAETDAAIKMLVFQKWMDAINAAGGHVIDPKSSTPSSSSSLSEELPATTGAW